MRVALSSLIVLLAAPAWGDPAAQCEDLYVEADFAAVRDCVARTLDRVSEEPDAISHAYALLAATELAAKRESEARRAIDVALAIDPALDPDDPILRAPRVRALLSSSRPRRDDPLTLRPQTPQRAGEQAVRFGVRVEGLRAPLTVLLRYRVRGSAHVATGWRHAAMTPARDDDGSYLAVLHRPEPDAAIDTQFVVQTPDGITVRRVVGASVAGQRTRTLVSPAIVDPTRRAPADPAPNEPARGSEPSFVGTFAFWSVLAVGSAALVGLAALSQSEHPTFFRFQLP